MILCNLLDFNYLIRNFQPTKSAIRLGRNSTNEIHIIDKLVSRIHCTIQFDKVVGWTIRDGYSNKINKKVEYIPSTNGTWIYINGHVPLADGMVVKSANLIFEVQIDDTGKK